MKSCKTLFGSGRQITDGSASLVKLRCDILPLPSLALYAVAAVGPGREADFCAFIGLNPSTADERNNDPTVTRCINFAKAWGFPGMWMLNLFGLRSTDPRLLSQTMNPYGDDNWQTVLQVVTQTCSKIVLCWGNHGQFDRAGDRFLSQLLLAASGCSKPLFCFGRTKVGEPKHPLYLPGNAPLMKWDETWHAS